MLPNLRVAHVVCAGIGVVGRLQNNALWRETQSIFRGYHDLIGFSTDVDTVGFWVCFVHNVAGVEESHDLAGRCTAAGVVVAVVGRRIVAVTAVAGRCTAAGRVARLNPGRTRKHTVFIASCIWRNRNRERLPRQQILAHSMSPKAELVGRPLGSVLVKRVVDGLKLTKSVWVIHPTLRWEEMKLWRPKVVCHSAPSFAFLAIIMACARKVRAGRFNSF